MNLPRLLLVSVSGLCMLGSPLTTAATTRGILVYHPFPESPPKFLSFLAISWQGVDGGSCIDAEGHEHGFSNGVLDNLIYLDPTYWSTVDKDESQRIFRNQIRPLEVVLPVNRQTIVEESDIAQVSKGIAQIDSLLVSYPTLDSILGPVRFDLNQQRDRYNEGQREVLGHWLTPEEYAKSVAPQKIGESSSPEIDSKTAESGSESFPIPATLRAGVSVNQATVQRAMEIQDQGWVYLMPQPKSSQAAWGNTDGASTWFIGYWINTDGKQNSLKTPIKNAKGIYVGDGQGLSGWRLGGSPPTPTKIEWLCSRSGGPPTNKP